MAVSRQSKLVFDQALTRAFALERRLERFRHRYGDRDDLPGLQLLLQALALITAELERLIIGQTRDLSDRASAKQEEEARSVVEAASSAVALLTGPHLELLGRQHGRDFDPLVQPLVRLAREMAAHEDTELIFRPTEGATYAAAFWVNERLEDLAKQVAPELRSTLRRLPRLQVLYYPASSEQETFQHSIVAHEIAHITLRQPWSDHERVGGHFYGAALRSMVEDIGQLAIGRVDRALNADEQRLDLLMAETRTILARTERWFTELACDLLALRTVGPAFFFALFEFVAPFGNWQQSGETHPASGWRLHRLIPEVNRYLPRSWRHLARSWTAGAEDLAEPRAMSAAVVERFRGMIPASGRVDPVEQRLVETALDALRAELDRDSTRVLRQAAYAPATFRADLDLVWDCLERGIAPAERVRGRTAPRRLGVRRVRGAWSDALDWRSILNGGWLYWLSRNDGSLPTYRRDAFERDARRLHFNGHILGSIELSEIQRQALELKETLSVLELRSSSHRARR